MSNRASSSTLVTPTQPKSDEPLLVDRAKTPPIDPTKDQSRPPLPTRLSRRLTQTSTPLRKKIRKLDFGIIPIPKNRRHDPNLKPEEQFLFTWRMNLVFAAASTVSVMNLYYVQPMLVQIAQDLSVSNDVVSRVPTLAQAGYGCGIVLITPLGDLVRRRQLVLLLMFLTSTLTIGIALSRNVQTLGAISFIVGLLTVTPQICIPWTADLAPSNRRARAMSITLSGLITGLVIGRVLAGIISNFSSWRNTYRMAVGLQAAMTGVLWLVLPDTPDKSIGLSYFGVLLSMAKFLTQYPTLVQACGIAFLTSGVFAGFWTTLTFLLSDDPYSYNSLDIGLFGLLGIIGALLAPQWGKLVDRVVPWLGQFSGLCISLTSMVIALAAARRNIGAICASIVLYDMGQQLCQISASYRIAGIDPKARARLNGCYLLWVFVGQTSGTAIITKIYNTYGWTPTGATCVAFVGAAMLVLLVRGPHEVRWIGWRGGSQLLKREKLTDLSPQAITERVRDKKEKVVAAVVGGDEAERGGAGEGFLEHAEMPGAESGRRD